MRVLLFIPVRPATAGAQHGTASACHAAPVFRGSVTCAPRGIRPARCGLAIMADGAGGVVCASRGLCRRPRCGSRNLVVARTTTRFSIHLASADW